MKCHLIIMFATEIFLYPGKFAWADTYYGWILVTSIQVTPVKPLVYEISFIDHTAGSQFTHECNTLFQRLLPT